LAIKNNKNPTDYGKNLLFYITKLEQENKLDIKIAERTLMPLRAKLKLYENLPYGNELIRRLRGIIEFTENDIIETRGDDEAYELEEFYDVILRELDQYYVHFFNYISTKEFTVLSTQKEKILFKKYQETKKTKEIKDAGKTLGKLISKRFGIENAGIMNKDKNFLNYFERKIIEKIISTTERKALDYFEQLNSLQETAERLFPKRDYLPNKKYSAEYFNFVIELKEKDGIPFVRGVQKLEEIKKIQINYESFLRRLSNYYNKRKNKNRKQTSDK
jgi:hypothetical protein